MHAILSSPVSLRGIPPAVHPVRATTAYLNGPNLSHALVDCHNRRLTIQPGHYLRTLDGALLCTASSDTHHSFIAVTGDDLVHATAETYAAWLAQPDIKAWKQPPPPT